MSTLMQLLLEALKANVEERRNELRPMANDQLTDEMTGFIVENVHVATMPYIDTEEEVDLPNPLLRLVRNRERPRRERLWLAAAEVDDDGTGEDEASLKKKSAASKGSSKSSKSNATKSKSTSRGSPASEKTRVETRPIRLEKEERSCFAKLLFTRCFTGKDNSAGWKIKRRCPNGAQKVSLSCPCGMIGPCKHVKQNACPIDQMNSTPKKNTKGTIGSGGSKNSKNPKNKGSQRSATSSGGSRLGKPIPLMEKLLPCCFKEHKHTECCCRCKDNPPLPRASKVSKKGSGKKPTTNSSVSQTSSKKKSSNKSRKGTSSEDEGETQSESDNQSTYETYTIRSIPSFYREQINRLSRKQATGNLHSSKWKENVQNLRETRMANKVASSLESKDPLNGNSSTKSTTSFQITLHPDISNDRIVEPEVVSHQILKTLSTIHGPVKVEQKIVVQGTKNSIVIVTHGEACQCNLCNMLKGKMHPKELIEGLSPQVVKISTDNGSNTLINHSDGCKCDLCRVLDPVIADSGANRASQFGSENVVMTASTSNENGSGKKTVPSAVQTLHSEVNQSVATPAATETNRKETVKISSVAKTLKCKTSAVKKKARKCRCTKCRQRRRIEKLKLRLKKEIGSEEYMNIMGELSRPNDEDRGNSKHRKTSIQSDSDDDDYAKPKKHKRQVSFSDEQYRGGSVERAASEENLRKRRCKLCELASMNVKQGNGIYKFESSRSRMSPDYSTNYCVNTNSRSQDGPCEFHLYRGMLPKESSENPYRSKSRSNEKAAYKGGVFFKLEQQTCFPPTHLPKRSSESQGDPEKRGKDSAKNENTDRSRSRHPSNCSGKCRREEANSRSMDHPGYLVSEAAFPQKFVYWSSGSRSNVATVYSSDSYYVPDRDEFPIVNVKREESPPSSSKGPMERVQIPVWFRMTSDRNQS